MRDRTPTPETVTRDHELSAACDLTSTPETARDHELSAARDLTLRGPAYEWALWSTTARLAVADPHALPSARRLVDHQLAAVELAASRFRADSEIRRLAHRGGRPTHVSAVCAELLDAALGAARETSGAVDPTLGNALALLGYDRDFATVSQHGEGIRVVSRPAPGWQRIGLDRERRMVTVPPDVVLDLGATAKAWAADRCARVVADELGIGVLVSLGGDIATAGPGPRGGWPVLVHDQEDDPAGLVTLPAHAAMATSSTRSRQWRRDGRELHHILDPATCLPVEPVWRSVTVAADSCVGANTWSTAAIVAGHWAPTLLARHGFPARLVDVDGRVTLLEGWPADTEVADHAGEVTRAPDAGDGIPARRPVAPGKVPA